MDKKYKFYKTTENSDEYDIFTLPLPFALIYKKCIKKQNLFFKIMWNDKGFEKLQDRKLIKREASPTDKRSMLVCLTQDGEELAKDCLSKIAKSKEEMFSLLTKKESEDLKRIFSKITYSFV